MNSSQRLGPNIKTKAIHQMRWWLRGKGSPQPIQESEKEIKAKVPQNWQAGETAPKAMTTHKTKHTRL